MKQQKAAGSVSDADVTSDIKEKIVIKSYHAMKEAEKEFFLVIERSFECEISYQNNYRYRTG